MRSASVALGVVAVGGGGGRVADELDNELRAAAEAVRHVEPRGGRPLERAPREREREAEALELIRVAGLAPRGALRQRRRVTRRREARRQERAGRERVEHGEVRAQHEHAHDVLARGQAQDDTRGAVRAADARFGWQM
jgi:hypothetical protein